MTITRRSGAVALLVAATLAGAASTLALALRREVVCCSARITSIERGGSPLLAAGLSAADRVRAFQALEKYRAARPLRVSDHFHRWCFDARRAPYPVNKDLQSDVARILSQSGFRQAFRGSAPLFFRSPYGWEVRQRTEKYARQHWQYEHHIDQFLATCAEIGAPLNLPIESDFGPTTVGELLEASRRSFDPSQEVNWTLAAYCAFLPEEPEWTNRFGEVCSYRSIVKAILTQPPGEGSCGGTHNQLALAHFLISPSAGRLDRSLLQQCEDYLASASHLLERGQLPNGAWTPLWAQNPTEAARSDSHPVSGDDLVRITGHHLEWISMVPAALRPSSACTGRALKFLIWALERANSATIEHDYCAYSHAAGVIQCALLQAPQGAREINRPLDAGIFQNPGSSREGSRGAAQNP
jgi:hypothetical protein